MQSLPVVLSSYPTWGLDPLFHTHVKLPLSALTRMTVPALPPSVAVATLSGVRLYNFGPALPARPLQLIHVSGYVVSCVRYRKSLRFVLDDGSGVGHCAWYHDGRDGSWTSINLGVYMSVMGKLCGNGGEGEVVEVIVQLSEFSTSPDAEMLWWIEVRQAHEECYWVKTDNRVAECNVRDGIGANVPDVTLPPRQDSISRNAAIANTASVSAALRTPASSTAKDSKSGLEAAAARGSRPRSR
eukprot:Plantae.Rhodophyta-Palmaria_palmata.ctg4367.p1 GENE.Plantae.Rhodophyta-Palmaria_palmata.ctg4367~~Plantae.Rhodophyta-Palmaria_palmata.ctg4367.p1  ORF type:complete len:242 (-),score=8.20 Plantae.Rhodophyta-Palmaria_palmata.ctg4367:48-773(-)